MTIIAIILIILKLFGIITSSWLWCIWPIFLDILGDIAFCKIMIWLLIKEHRDSP